MITFQKEKVKIIIYSKILNGEDKRTSVILKNIPYDMTKLALSEMLSGVGNINYLYLPFDKNTNKNEGFAFVNIINYKNVINICKKLENLNFEKLGKAQKIEVIYSKIQGKNNLCKLFWSKN